MLNWKHRRDDIATAVVLLSCCPVRVARPTGAGAVWAYPLVGAGIGGLAAMTHVAVSLAGLGPSAAAGVALAASVVATRALHEDGTADTADGLWGGWTRERRLEIMRDSRIGAFGVVAIVLTLLLRWAALTELDAVAPLALIAAGALSRAAIGSVWAALAPARDDGLSASTGRPTGWSAVTAITLSLLIAVIAIGPAAGIAAMTMALAVLWLARTAKALIGGQTGDILGATQVVADVIVLLTLAAVIT